MQNMEVSGAVRHIYIYIYVIRRLKVKLQCRFTVSVNVSQFGKLFHNLVLSIIQFHEKFPSSYYSQNL